MDEQHDREGPIKMMTCEGCKYLHGMTLEEGGKVFAICHEESVYANPGKAVTMKEPQSEFPLSTFLSTRGGLPIPNPNCPFLEKE